jgi:hypothetical protein
LLGCTGAATPAGRNLITGEDPNNPTCGWRPLVDLTGDPRLAPLADNGGPTLTQALLADSPALATALNCPPPATDQRGVIRPQGGGCDIGAFESSLPVAPTLTPTPTVTPTPTPGILGDINGDGIVDIRDYGIWRQSFGQTNCGNVADLDANCIVDSRDYGIWRQHFGETAGGTAPGGARAAAQPPATATARPAATPAAALTPGPAAARP